MKANRRVVRGTLAMIIAAGIAAGCTQGDVKNADSAFHQVAQGTHDVGKKVVHGATEVGHDIKQTVDNPKH